MYMDRGVGVDSRALQAGVTGSIPVTSTNFFSDCKGFPNFISTPIPRFWSQLCTNAVIAVRLCTLEPPLCGKDGLDTTARSHFSWFQGAATAACGTVLRLQHP